MDIKYTIEQFDNGITLRWQDIDRDRAIVIPDHSSNGLRFENLRKSGGAIPQGGSTRRNNMPQQLELFRTPPKPTKQVTNAERRYDTTPYDHNAFHRIYEIKDDGEREWVDSYSSKFSVQYAMEIFYCNKRHLNFFDVNNISKAKEAVKISKTMRSVILELDGRTYICSSKHGSSVIEGINCNKFDFKPFRPI